MSEVHLAFIFIRRHNRRQNLLDIQSRQYWQDGRYQASAVYDIALSIRAFVMVMPALPKPAHLLVELVKR